MNDEHLIELLDRGSNEIATIKSFIPMIEAELKSENPRIPALEGEDARRALVLILEVSQFMIATLEEMRRPYTQ